MASKRTKIIVGGLLGLALVGGAAKVGIDRVRATRAAEVERHERVMHVDDAVRDCRAQSDEVPERIDALLACRAKLDAEIDQEAAIGMASPSFAKKAHEDVAHEIDRLVPGIAVVDKLSAKLRDEHIERALREDRRWAISQPHDLGAAALLARTIGDDDYGSDRNNALRTFRDHAMLDVLKRVAGTGKEDGGLHGHDDGFRGAISCLLGETKAGLAAMARLDGSNGIIARRACGAAVASEALAVTKWPEPDVKPFVSIAISILPSPAGSEPPEKALTTFVASVNAKKDVTAPDHVGIETAALALGASPSKEHALAWANAVAEKCEASYPNVNGDAWYLAATPSVGLQSAPPAASDPEREAISAHALLKSNASCEDGAWCCPTRRVWNLGRALLYRAVVAEVKQGHRVKARERLLELEALDPTTDTSTVWLAIDGYDEAAARAEKVLAAETSPSLRKVRAGLDLAAAKLARRDFAAAYVSAERARNDRRALPWQHATAPDDAMEALWLMVASGVLSGRAPPTDLPRWETAPEKRLHFEDKTRLDAEAFALEVWTAGMGTSSERTRMRRTLWGRRDRGSPTTCVQTLTFATLAKDGDPEPWIDALDARAEYKNFGQWRGGAIARARCKAMVLGVMAHPSAKVWSERADRLAALIKDAKTAMLAHYVGL